MDEDEALRRFGLPPSPGDRDEIRRLLADEARRGGDESLMRLLCAQLFALGHAEDAVLVWRAKSSTFDAGCSVDVQLLCGAGLGPTKQYLAALPDPEAAAAVRYVEECERAGDFDGFTPAGWLAECRRYYAVG